MQKRSVLSILSTIIVLMMGAMSVQAGVPNVDSTSASSDCDTITVSWSHSSGTETEVTIFYGSEMEMQSFLGSSGTFNFDFTPDLADGTLIEIEIQVFEPRGTKLIPSTSFVKATTAIEGIVTRFPTAYSFFAINCAVDAVEEDEEDEGFVSLCPDGRLTYTLCDPLIVYNVVSDDGIGLVMYMSSRDNAGIGEFQLEIPAETFASLPETPTQNCTIASSADGSVVVYLLASGEIQIDAGPDDEGKVFSYIFNDLVSSPASINTYFSDTTPTILPVC